MIFGNSICPEAAIIPVSNFTVMTSIILNSLSLKSRFQELQLPQLNPTFDIFHLSNKLVVQTLVLNLIPLQTDPRCVFSIKANLILVHFHSD